MKSLRLGLAQINCTVGDIDGNVKKIIDRLKQAKRLSVDLAVFPELSITGYPPEDLLLKKSFIEKNRAGLKEVSSSCRGLAAVVGFVDNRPRVANAAAIIHDGRVVDVYHKILLPNYGVFDEKRYFEPGSRAPVYVLGGVRIGVNICEDIWTREGPTGVQARRGGAKVIININASPYHAAKWRMRQKMLSDRARENGVMVAYTNMVGGQDELVFDGHSLIIDERGNVLARGLQFAEDFIVFDLPINAERSTRTGRAKFRKTPVGRSPLSVDTIILRKSDLQRARRPVPARSTEPLGLLEEIHTALVLGVRDYFRKNGFSRALVGLSGGIDSAYTAVVAADALGKENVMAVFMPSPYTSRESEEDASDLARRLGVRLARLPIHAVFEAYLKTLSGEFEGRKPDIAEENLQARIRGNLLMALSNKFGWLVLTTGNKSEMSVGYATLYGDMAGGFAVIKDVPKTLVYRLARWRNTVKETLPERLFTKPPTAELRPNQKDEDSLPPYDVLDPILLAYVEEDKGFDEIALLGYDKKVIRKVMDLVDSSEYKRRQAPIGIKITPRAFGRDRRMPVTNRFKSR